VPSNVARFEQLMYSSIGIGLIISALTWNRNVAQAGPLGGVVFVLFVGAFVLGSMVLLIWLAARRHKNWARCLYLILWILGLPAFVGMLSRMLHLEPFVAALMLAQSLAQAVALVLVFTGNARDWFKPSAHSL